MATTARKPHTLTKTKKSVIPANVIYFDSEAYVTEKITKEEQEKILSGEVVLKEHDTYLICGCFKRTGRGELWKDYHGENFKFNFWESVDKFAQYGQTTYLYAHNAKYDILATKAIPLLLDLNYRVESFSEDNPFIVELIKEEVDKKPKKLLILSTTNYFKNSLKELGKTFNLEKLESAYNDTLENAIKYCRRDVEIIVTAMESFFQFVEENKLGSVAKTIAGQSFNAYRARFLEHDIYIHCDETAIEIERESYSGGRTEVWRIGKCKNKLYYLDVNSMYPYVMLEKKYPIKLITTRTNTDINKLKWFILHDYLVCARVKIKTDKRIFPLKHKGKLIFPIGEFTCCLSTPEIKKALELNCIVEVKEFSVYEQAEIFKNYVTFFYNARLKAKEIKDKVRDYLYKLFMNTLYGKFGQKVIDWEEIGKTDKDILKIEYIYDVERGTYKTIKIIGGIILQNTHKIGIENESYNSFPAIASHVTSYARMLLWSYIEIAGEENIYYMDTDSIICNKKGYENLKKAGHIDSKQLGKLDLEKSGYFTFYGLKDYEYRETKEAEPEVKIKGINLKGLSNGSLVKLSNTKFITSQWIGVSKMIRENKINNNYYNRLQVKNLTRKYEKGIIEKGGKVSPIKF